MMGKECNLPPEIEADTKNGNAGHAPIWRKLDAVAEDVTALKAYMKIVIAVAIAMLVKLFLGG